VDELVKDGIVERYRGRGTVVLDIPINYPIQKNNRFTETLKSLGHQPESKILKKELIQAKDGIARRLEINEGQQVLWMETLRFTDKRPIGVSAQFLVQPYAEVVLEAYEGGSLHQFLLDEFGLKLKRAYSLITAVLPQEEDARWLQMSRRQPILRMKTVNVDEKDEAPVEYAVARSRADLVQVRIDLD
jgi:GntR family phosphonate transport system transcriptional regulator